MRVSGTRATTLTRTGATVTVSLNEALHRLVDMTRFPSEVEANEAHDAIDAEMPVPVAPVPNEPAPTETPATPTPVE